MAEFTTGDWVTVGVDLANNIGNNIHSERLAMQARDWQEKMWNKQNEYNLPINQRKRLEDAGLNPNLAFGSSASAMGTSVPGSPETPTAKFNLGEFYLRKKQIEAQVRAQNASTNRENEVTRQLEMNNVILEQLLQDKIVTQRGDMFVQRILQGWQEEHMREQLDLGLRSDQAKLDAVRASKLLTDAQRERTEQSKKNLEQAFDYLDAKYGYEKGYYYQNMNPNETSTPLGVLRYIMGNIQNVIQNWNNPNAW